eukprot:TRINITY_DN12352_c0_g1_i1.p1 TRINITY_DN12352_c0_g1~~TRINITY_DN12352_c0_g1_i1.p1  ORF type:complete len:413 (-),score=51.95 TRINITY_DN12352_c0_g1_i1:273-1511(-)
MESTKPDNFFPNTILRQIVTHVIRDADKSTSVVFDLVAMCGVCRQWRALIPTVGVTLPLILDSSPTKTITNHKAQKKFQQLKDLKQQQAFFKSAARLLKGRRELILSGDAICDHVLCDIILNNRNVTKLTISNTQNLHDVGLVTMSLLATKLRELELEEISGLKGSFISPLMQNCVALKNLKLRRLSGLQWDELQHSSRHWPVCRNMKNLEVKMGDNSGDFSPIIQTTPNLDILNVDGAPRNIYAAVESSKQINHLSYMIHEQNILKDALPALTMMPKMTILEIVVENVVLTPFEMKFLGLISVDDLSIISSWAQSADSKKSTSISHVNNEGIKAFVDGVRERVEGVVGVKPMKLALAGASDITHEGVSELLRLPWLIKLCVKGCNRISAMDKMRLTAKVKAGVEMWQRLKQ